MAKTGPEKARILVVEDENIVAIDIQRRLQGLGYHVLAIASSGEQAIQKVETENPNLVLMDIRLKGKLDGVETAAVLKERFHVPVIFLTAYADQETLDRAAVTEAFGYILKPFQERELAINIDMALFKHHMETRLRESEERFSLAVRGAKDGLWDWNIQSGDSYFSPRFYEMLGLEENEFGLAIDTWKGLIHPEDLAEFQRDLSDHLEGKTSHFQNEHRILNKSGSYCWVITRGLAVRDARGSAYRIAGSQSDITERKQAEQQLIHDALHDSLTGLPNRSLLTERLGRTMERARRNPDLIYAVLFLDLDRFKVINDSLGHHLGDQLLVALAKRLETHLRGCDTLARLGGDEFVALVEDLTSPEAANLVADRFMEDLKPPFQINGQTVFTSASIGIVIGAATYQHPDEILRDADIAMYRAKAAGKSRYAMFDTLMREGAIARLEIEGDLRAALQRQELRVYYQPILTLETGQVTGFEALLRWVHPTRGMILPADFIALAEETGLILSIGRWVLEEACRQLHEWQELFPSQPPLSMSVNISARQLTQVNMVEQVSQILQETSLDPHTLKLEITEHMIIDNSANAVETLTQLRQLGVQVLIDDFGTGYSSLGYVQNFPIDTIKIDRIFINQMGSHGSGPSEIAHTIIRLAHELGIGTIAEGIETREQLERLQGMDCELGQGWLFAKALSREKTETFLRQASQPGQPLIHHPRSLVDSPDEWEDI